MRKSVAMRLECAMLLDGNGLPVLLNEKYVFEISIALLYGGILYIIGKPTLLKGMKLLLRSLVVARVVMLAILSNRRVPGVICVGNTGGFEGAYQAPVTNFKSWIKHGKFELKYRPETRDPKPAVEAIVRPGAVAAVADALATDQTVLPRFDAVRLLSGTPLR
jgi:hypothetical protein